MILIKNLDARVNFIPFKKRKGDEEAVLEQQQLPFVQKVRIIDDFSQSVPREERSTHRKSFFLTLHLRSQKRFFVDTSPARACLGQLAIGYLFRPQSVPWTFTVDPEKAKRKGEDPTLDINPLENEDPFTFEEILATEDVISVIVFLKQYEKNGQIFKSQVGIESVFDFYKVTRNLQGKLESGIENWVKSSEVSKRITGSGIMWMYEKDEKWDENGNPPPHIIEELRHIPVVRPPVRRDEHVLRTLRGHTDWVGSVTTMETPQGIRIVSGSSDHTIKIWKLERNLVTTIRGHRSKINSVTTVKTPQGIRIISGSSDGTIKIWTWKGNLVTTLRGHTKSISSVITMETSLGIRIVSGSFDHTIKIWTLEGNLVTTLQGHTGWVNSVTTMETPQGIRIVSVSDDDTIKIWTWEGNLIKTLQGHTESVISLTTMETPQGIRIVSGSVDDTIKIWTWEGNLITTLRGHADSVISLTTMETPQGIRIVSGSDDNTIKIWTWEGNLVTTLQGHTGWVGSVTTMETPQGIRIVSGSSDNTIKIWDVTFLNPLQPPGPVRRDEPIEVVVSYNQRHQMIPPLNQVKTGSMITVIFDASTTGHSLYVNSQGKTIFLENTTVNLRINDKDHVVFKKDNQSVFSWDIVK